MDRRRSRAYRWGEDGIAGISDDQQRLCFSLALWNGKDQILKERLFGLTNSQGNHGEDVKEYYFYLDSTPTHSYMKYLYKYPQAAYPYKDLVETNGRRSREEMEYELLDTGVFHENRYFDVVVEYAKGGAEDILVRITAENRGPEAADLHLLPTLWFRNDWSTWIASSNRAAERPRLTRVGTFAGGTAVAAAHPLLGKWRRRFPIASRGSSCATAADAGRCTAAPRSFSKIRTGATTSSSTNTSTATMGPASVRVTRPGGRASWRS